MLHFYKALIIFVCAYLLIFLQNLFGILESYFVATLDNNSHLVIWVIVYLLTALANLFYVCQFLLLCESTDVIPQVYAHLSQDHLITKLSYHHC